MGVAYMTTFSTIQGTCGYKVFECATQYMWVISQNATFFSWCDLCSKFGEFWGYVQAVKNVIILDK